MTCAVQSLLLVPWNRPGGEAERQGIGNEIVTGAAPQGQGTVEVKERLGGLLNYYHRKAA